MIRRGLFAVALLVLVTGTARAAQVVDIDEHLGAPLPRVAFTDDNGHAVQLSDYFRDGRPVVLVLAYFRCTTLCDLLLRNTADALGRTGLRMGKDYRALTVSFDPRDTPAEATLKQTLLRQSFDLHAPASDWPFVVGEEQAISALADRLGFRYVYDPKSDQYAHPACAFVLTPDGRISRYLYGVDFRPLDLKLALLEAARGKVGGIVDRVLLTCFRYDPSTRRYGVYVAGVMKGGAALCLLLVAGGLAFLWRKERARKVAS